MSTKRTVLTVKVVEALRPQTDQAVQDHAMRPIWNTPWVKTVVAMVAVPNQVGWDATVWPIISLLAVNLATTIST